MPDRTTGRMLAVPDITHYFIVHSPGTFLLCGGVQICSENYYTLFCGLKVFPRCFMKSNEEPTVTNRAVNSIMYCTKVKTTEKQNKLEAYLQILMS